MTSLPANQTDHWIAKPLGHSVQGRLITLYLSHFESNTLNTLILAAFHGDEPESVDLAQRFLESPLPQNVRNKAVGVITQVNPDGLSQDQRTNANGVDLNRNFPTLDWQVHHELGHPMYSGPKAASEPETQLMMDLIEQTPPQKIVSLHTPYQVNNYDGPAEGLAGAMAKENGFPCNTDIGYPTPGSFGTYVGQERQIPIVTLELPEKEAYNQTAIQQNLNALYAAIAWEPKT